MTLKWSGKTGVGCGPAGRVVTTVSQLSVAGLVQGMGEGCWRGRVPSRSGARVPVLCGMCRWGIQLPLCTPLCCVMLPCRALGTEDPLGCWVGPQGQGRQDGEVQGRKKWLRRAHTPLKVAVSKLGLPTVGLRGGPWGAWTLVPAGPRGAWTRLSTFPGNSCWELSRVATDELQWPGEGRWP